MAALIYSLILVLLESYMLMEQLSSGLFFLIVCCILGIVATGLLFSINSFMVKFGITSALATFGMLQTSLDIRSSLLFFALFFHVACLWCEVERFSRSDNWEPHYKVSHKMRHNWLGGLCFIGGLLSAYVILEESSYTSQVYSMGLLCISAAANLAYMEGNRLHNINAFWVDVIKPLSTSGQYWRLMLFSIAVFVALGINFTKQTVERVVNLRQYFEKEEINDSSKEKKSNVKGKTTAGFNPGEVTLSSKVDIELSDEKEFYVKIHEDRDRRRLMNRPLYMGAQELVIYNGRSWLPKNTNVEWFNDADDGRKDGFTRVGIAQKNSIRHTVYFIKPEMSAVFALPGLHTVQLPEVYMSALGVLGVRPGIAEGNRKYTVYSSAYDYGNLQIDKSLMFGYPGDEYLALPSGEIIDKINALNSKIINSKMSLLQRMDALKDFLGKNCKYSLKVENKYGKEPLDNFLFHERKGHCLLYASAFTIMLRQAGIPARMVNGFAGGSYDRRNNLFVMKSSNAHAWTEVFFNRYGWVAVDPTPEAENIQPDTTQVEDFDESEFSSLNATAEARAKAQSNLPFFLQDTDSVILAVCVLLVILSYSWQYLRRIPAFVVRKKPDAVQRFSPKPDFILEFETLCLLEGVKLSKAKTPKEMLSDIIVLQGTDEELQSMVDYYYNLRFAEGERAQDKESNWLSYLTDRVKQAKSKNI